MKKVVLIVSVICLIMLGSYFMLNGDEESINDSGTNSVRKSNRDVIQTDEIVTNISTETSWAYNVTDPLVVQNHSDYLLKIRVNSKETTKYFVQKTTMPSSTYNVEVLEVLINDNGTVLKNIKLAANGGIVSMQEYVNTMDEETKVKSNVNKLTKKELDEKVLIKDESYYELKQGQEYYVFVRDLTNDDNYKGYYGMPEVGYDVFEEKDGQYINVLTNAKVDI